MRMAAVRVFATLVGMVVALPAQATSPVEDQFKQFDLFGQWAPDCNRPATPANPHVSITMPSEGLVLEEHDLGADFARNYYSVLAAARISETRLSVEVIFQPGAQDEERQKLTFLIGKGSRRTLFNQPNGGEVRVKDGVALAHHTKTPVLRKCD
jgi:hypothetical protein